MKLLFLDTETTGNDVSKDRLCQICYHADGKTVNSLFRPPVPISIKAASITHITDKMVADKPPFKGSPEYAELESLLKDHVLVAHNSKFDIAILEAEGLKVPRFICTLRVARALDAENFFEEYNLQFLRYAMGLEIEGSAHDAEGDVNVLRGVFDRLFRKVRAGTATDDEAIGKMIEISSHPSLFKKFTFGKCKGMTLEEVAKKDRSYLEWMLKEKQKAPENEEDWIYTLNHYLGAR